MISMEASLQKYDIDQQRLPSFKHEIEHVVHQKMQTLFNLVWTSTRATNTSCKSNHDSQNFKTKTN